MIGGYQANPYFNQMNAWQQCALKGRVVSNVEEAKSAFIDLDGSITYFPCVSDNCIYTKSIGLDGQAIFKTYRLVEQPQMSMPSMQTLEQRIARLERVLENVSRPATTDDKSDVREQS